MTNVTIYTTPTCTYCKAAKQFFSDHNIVYAEVDVAKDRQAAQYIVSKSGQLGVPIIIVEKNGKEEVVVGFDKPRLSQLLEIA